MSDPPEILNLTEVAAHRYLAGQPTESPEGRDVIFSGQLLGQMILASEREAGEGKEVRSVHTIFARAGRYSKPLELTVESMQAGRTWGSDTVTATQDGKLLARGLVLLNTVDPDLMRHGPAMPTGVPHPRDLEPGAGQVFPGCDWRPLPGEVSRSGVPGSMAWHRRAAVDDLRSPGEHQAVLGWATCGHVIGLAMQPHRDTVSIADAHRSISTGVIAHTIHFTEAIDVSRWLLVVTEGSNSGRGRIYGQGWVFSEDGQLVAVFHQDAMAKAVQPTAGSPNRL